VTLWVALSQPWLGLTLAPDPDTHGVRITAIHPDGPARAVTAPVALQAIDAGAREQAIRLEPNDLVEEPDLFETYAETRDFMQRQGALAALLRAGAVTLHLGTADAPQSVVVQPTRRPISDLPLAFWIQIVTGAGSLLIGAWVWAMRPADIATRLFAFSGAMIALSAYAAAIYSSRELAIEGGTFRLMSALNHTGAIGFGLGMIAMFLCYPRRLVPPWALWVVPGIFVPWLAADILHLPPSQPIGSQFPTLLEMLLIIAIVGVQWFVNRRDARARAALSWLGLSVIVGAGAFVTLIIAPILFDSPPIMQQGYAFGFFLLIYAGLALGVGRYRLFDLSEWAFRVLFYTGGTLLLVGIDAALITLLHMQQATSFGIALLAVGFIYLPLRGALWHRFVSPRALEEHEMFRAVIDVSFALSAAERSQRWREFLQRLFDPLALEIADGPVGAVDIRDEGSRCGFRPPPIRRPWCCAIRGAGGGCSAPRIATSPASWCG
jgi:hypothetical protein